MNMTTEGAIYQRYAGIYQGYESWVDIEKILYDQWHDKRTCRIVYRTPQDAGLGDGAKLFNRMLADLGDIPCKYPCLRDDFHDWLDKQPDGIQWLAEKDAI